MRQTTRKRCESGRLALCGPRSSIVEIRPLDAQDLIGPDELCPRRGHRLVSKRATLASKSSEMLNVLDKDFLKHTRWSTMNSGNSHHRLPCIWAVVEFMFFSRHCRQGSSRSKIVTYDFPGANAFWPRPRVSFLTFLESYITPLLRRMQEMHDR